MAKREKFSTYYPVVGDWDKMLQEKDKFIRVSKEVDFSEITTKDGTKGDVTGSVSIFGREDSERKSSLILHAHREGMEDYSAGTRYSDDFGGREELRGHRTESYTEQVNFIPDDFQDAEKDLVDEMYRELEGEYTKERKQINKEWKGRAREVAESMLEEQLTREYLTFPAKSEIGALIDEAVDNDVLDYEQGRQIFDALYDWEYPVEVLDYIFPSESDEAVKEAEEIDGTSSSVHESDGDVEKKVAISRTNEGASW